MTKEEFYDAEIAPALFTLMKKAAEKGLSFVSVVEWEPGEFGRTAHLQTPHGLGIEMANVAAQANGNADTLIGYMVRHAQARGHGSIYLRQLGVSEIDPRTKNPPEAPKADGEPEVAF